LFLGNLDFQGLGFDFQIECALARYFMSLDF
jgi:hypothetical protein